MIWATIIALLVVACWFRLVWYAIQPGQIFGKWQHILEDWDKKGYSIVKALGYCELCTAHLFAYVGFIGLLIFAWDSLNFWEGVLLYVCFIPLSAFLNYKIIK